MAISAGYIFSWLLVFLLSHVPVSGVVISISSEFGVFLFMSSFFLFFFEFALSRRIGRGYSGLSYNEIPDGFLIRMIGVVLLFFILVTALLEKGRVPVLSFIGIESVRYNEYGIGGLQGFINAVYLFFMSVCFYYRVLGKKIFSDLLFIVLLFYPLVIVSRQVFFICFIQFYLVWIFYGAARGGVKFFLSMIAFIFCFWLFGVVGDLRVESEMDGSAHSLLVSLLDATSLGESLPSSFLWVYAYLVTPSSNLLLNIQHEVVANGVSQYFAPLLPSPVRSLLGLDQGFRGFDNVLLVNDNLNMGTAFLAPYLTMGWLGIIFHFFLMMFFCFPFVVLRSSNIYFGLGYIVMVPVVALSIFANLLFYMPIIFQLFIFGFLGTVSLVFRRKMSTLKRGE